MPPRRREPKPQPEHQTVPRRAARVPSVLTKLQEGNLTPDFVEPPPATAPPAPPPWMLPVPSGSWTAWTQEKQDRCVELLMLGNRFPVACHMAGLSLGTAMEWRRKAISEIESGLPFDPTAYWHQFHAAIAEAMYRPEIRAAAIISTSPEAKDQQWWLTHGHAKKHWGVPTRVVDVKQNVQHGGTVVVRHEAASRARALSPEDLDAENERLAGLIEMFENEDGGFEALPEETGQ